MTQAIVHVGLHKTGTTSIQEALNGYDDGVTAYADLGPANHSYVFLSLFEREFLHHRWQNLGLSNAEQDRIIARNWSLLDSQLSRSRARIIFSGEEISTLSAEALGQLKSHFRRHGRDVLVVVFVREPLAMTASLLQQLVQGGRWLHNDDTEGTPVDYWLSRRLANILAVFGRERTRILYYEDACGSGHPCGAIDLFAATVGIQPEANPAGARLNQSIGETTFKLLNSFFQSGVVHDKGPMLQEVRWKFIAQLDAAVEGDARKPLRAEAVQSKVNWADYRQLNAFLERPYPLQECDPGAGRSFSAYCRDIDHAEVCRKLTAFFERRSIAVPATCTTHELVSLVFYQAMQDHVAKLGCEPGLDRPRTC